MRAFRPWLVVRLGFLALAIVLASPEGFASQCPAHFYVAYKALERVPEAVQNIIIANLDAYLAGATGPDIAQTAYVAEAFEFRHPGAPAHAGGHTSDVIVNMLRRAAGLSDRVARDRATAFAMGWLTHYLTDCYIHPLCNELGGNYGESSEHNKRHKRLELVECPRAFIVGGHQVLATTLKPGVVPAKVINDAFAATSSGAFLQFYASVPPRKSDFEQILERSSLIMSGVVDWMSSNHLGRSYAGPNSGELLRRLHENLSSLPLEIPGTALPDPTFAFSMILKGTPPQPRQYEKLMDPLVIDEVDWNFPDDLKSPAELKVRFTANDVHLFKLFCLQWDKRIQFAIRDSAAVLGALAGGLDSLALNNTNLNTGKPEGQPYEKGPNDPGNPNITRVLGRLSIRDDKGKELSPWPAEGKWIDIEFSEDRFVWEDFPLGGGQFTVPFKPGTSQNFDVRLSLGLADENKRLYGWPEDGHVIEAKWSRRLKRAMPPGKIEILRAEVYPERILVGERVEFRLEYKVLNIAGPKAEILEKVELVSDAIGGVRPLGPVKRDVLPDEEGSGVVKALYGENPSKPGNYAFSFDLEALGYQIPSGMSLGFKVDPMPAVEGIWVLDESRTKVEEFASPGPIPVMWDGKKEGEYSWTSKNFSSQASIQINHNNGERTQFAFSGRIQPAPPRELIPTRTFEIEVSCEASADMKSYNKTYFGAGDVQLHRFLNAQGKGYTGKVGWVFTPGEPPFVPSGRGQVKGTVPTGRTGATIAVVGGVGPVVHTSRSFYFEYVYRWVPNK